MRATSHPVRGAVLVAALTALTACSSSTASAPTTTTAATTSVATSTSAAATSTAPTTIATPTTVAPATVVTPTELPTTAAATTAAPTTAAPTTAAPTTAAPTTEPATTTPVPLTTAGGGTGSCGGPSKVPPGATNVQTIHGDIDGDVHDDTVTAYTGADGQPHVFAKLFTGGTSDTVVPIGFADHVEIGFEDIDHAAGATTPPPVAVMAIGAGNAGSAHIAFLTLNTKYCIKQWTLNGQPWSLRVSQQDPYTGLTCDGAAGTIYYVVVNAEQLPSGEWKVTSQRLTHNFVKAILTPLPDQTVPDSPDIPHVYGDIVNCGHAPLFP